MATTVEIEFHNDAADGEIDRAMSAMNGLGAWALELLDEARPARLLALLPEIDPARARAMASSALAGLPCASIEARPAASVDWGSGWKEALRATKIGPLWILPQGARAVSGAKMALEIETSGAFGSGVHQTTSLCLERIVELSPVEAILDVGTGTGILALSALMLGAKVAFGTDTDDHSLQVAARNAERAGLRDRLILSAPRPDALGRQFPLVVANIIAATLVEMAPELVCALGHDGVLLLSGVRVHEIDEVADVFQRFGLRRGGERRRDHWSCVELRASW